MEEGVVVGDQTLPRVITSGPAMVSSPRASVEEGWEEGDLSDTDSDSGHSAKGHAHGRDICCCFDAFCDSCCCAIDPNSSYKGAWDWFMIALVFYNCLYIPVQMAFQPEDPYWLAGFDGMVDAPETLGAMAPGLYEKMQAEMVPNDEVVLPASIADTYWHVHSQPRNCWTFDLDVRPWQTMPWFNTANNLKI